MFDFLSAYPGLTDAIGVAGFITYIISFCLVQTGRLCGNSVAFAAANVVAAAFVLVSLINAFNVASFLIQISFISIGLCGILRKLRQGKNNPSPVQAAA
ncbi:MAG: hypothetical protein OXC60_05965 [Litoreibacter sp.]|nr:hypothetical protein [Litoreibacter sp.]